MQTKQTAEKYASLTSSFDRLRMRLRIFKAFDSHGELVEP
jgi:hypothetical protein